jgi:hypothetical protein
MDRSESNPRIVRDDRFRSVAVVRIDIPDRYALSAVLERIERGDGDIAEVTETHGAIARGVMSGRAHKDKWAALSGKGSACGFDAGAGRFKCIVVNFWNSRCIEIEIANWIFDALDVFAGMRAQEFVIRGSSRFAPLPGWMSIFQYRDGLDDARWPFWMSGSGVINAARVVKNDHRKNWELMGTTLYRHGPCCIFEHSITGH